MATRRLTRSEARKQEQPSCAGPKVAFVHVPYISPRKMAQCARRPDERPGTYRRIAFVQMQQVDAHTRSQYARFDDEPTLDELTDVSSEVSSSDEGSSSTSAAVTPLTAKIPAPRGISHPAVHSNVHGKARSWCNRGASIIVILVSTALLAQLVGLLSIDSSIFLPDESSKIVIKDMLRPEQYEAVSQAATLTNDLTWNDGNELSKTISDLIKRSALVLENWDGRLQRSNIPELRNVGLPDLLDSIWSIHDSSTEMDSRVQEQLFPTAVSNAALKLRDELEYLREYTISVQTVLGPRTRPHILKNYLTSFLRHSRTRTIFKDWLQAFAFFAEDRETVSRTIVQQTEEILAINNRIIHRYGSEFYPLLKAIANNFKDICLTLERKKHAKACGPEVQLSKDFDIFKEEERRKEITLAFVKTIMGIQDAHRGFADELARSIAGLETMEKKSRFMSLEALVTMTGTVLGHIDRALMELQPFFERYAGVHG